MSDYESLNEEQRKVWDAAKASDHWMRQYELKDKELRKAKDEIAELVEDAIAKASDHWMRQETIKRLREYNDRLWEDSDHWMRQYELKDKELRKAKDEIAELKADAAANANARDYRMGQHELKDEELLKAKDEIAELKRRLERQWRALHSEVETRARLQEDNERLREDNERLSALLRSTEHNHAFERDHNGTQA